MPAVTVDFFEFSIDDGVVFLPDLALKIAEDRQRLGPAERGLAVRHAEPLR